MAAGFAASAARSSVNRLGGTKLVQSAPFLKNPTAKKAISYGAATVFGIATVAILSRKNKSEQPVAQEKKEEPAEDKK